MTKTEFQRDHRMYSDKGSRSYFASRRIILQNCNSHANERLLLLALFIGVKLPLCFTMDPVIFDILVSFTKI